MKLENLVTAREIYNNLIADFPDDYKSLIDNEIKDKSDSDIEDTLRQLGGTFLLNSYLNERHLFLEEEMNYLMEVKGYIGEKISELRNKQNLDFLKKKGKLTPEQTEKYSNKKELPKVEKEKIERFNKPSEIKSTFMMGVLVGVVGMSALVIILRLFGLL